MKKRIQAYTLIEVLLAVGVGAGLIGAVATLVPPMMHASRESTLSAGSNVRLSRSSDQLVDDISSGKNILRQAARDRIDLLKLQTLNPRTLPTHQGVGKENQIKLTVDTFSGLTGKEVILTNDTGDYLLNKVVSSEQVGTNWVTTFECPLTLPGALSAHTFTPLRLASTAGTGGGGQPDSLYRDTGKGWELAATSIKSVVFQPLEGDTFTDLKPVNRRIPQLMVGLTAAGERADNLSPANINPSRL